MNTSSQNQEKQISLLEVLKANPEAGQRSMAAALGLSLGMTNLLLKELVAKGWMLMRRLNARKVQYILTPEGIRELSRRSLRFLKSSVRLVAEWRQRLHEFVRTAKAIDAKGVWLVGQSDLGFLLEALCRQEGLSFGSSPTAGAPDGWVVVYGEEESTLRPNLLELVEPTVPLAGLS